MKLFDLSSGAFTHDTNVRVIAFHSFSQILQVQMTLGQDHSHPQICKNSVSIILSLIEVRPLFGKNAQSLELVPARLHERLAPEFVPQRAAVVAVLRCGLLGQVLLLGGTVFMCDNFM